MGAEAVLAEVGMPQDGKSFGVRTGSQGRHFRRPASEPPSPRHRAGPPLPSYAPPSGGPPADLRSPAVARCCGLGAKAPHATPPPCPRPPGLGAPPAIAWDSAYDRSLAAASSPAGVAVSPPPASPAAPPPPGAWRAPRARGGFGFGRVVARVFPPGGGGFSPPPRLAL